MQQTFSDTKNDSLKKTLEKKRYLKVFSFLYTHAYIYISHYIEQDFKTSACQNNSVLSDENRFPKKNMQKLHFSYDKSLHILFAFKF